MEEEAFTQLRDCCFFFLCVELFDEHEELGDVLEVIELIVVASLAHRDELVLMVVQHGLKGMHQLPKGLHVRQQLELVLCEQLQHFIQELDPIFELEGIFCDFNWVLGKHLEIRSRIDAGEQLSDGLFSSNVFVQLVCFNNVGVVFEIRDDLPPYELVLHLQIGHIDTGFANVVDQSLAGEVQQFVKYSETH